jgi:hypothetical protein
MSERCASAHRAGVAFRSWRGNGQSRTDKIRRGSRPGLAILALASAAVLAGCANQNTIFRKTDFQDRGVHVLTMDAKQRSVIVSEPVAPESDARDNPYFRRFCAEPPPDALSALSTSASGELGLSGLNSGNASADLKAALAISENASAIQRTQTVNLLRESMYRTCERYLSGAIDRSEFIVQSARDQRAMVAILAIEQLTQAAQPAPTVLMPGAAVTAAGGADLVKAVNDASDNQVDKKNAQAAAQKAYDDANSGAKKCPDLLKVTDKTQVAAADLDAWTKCGAADTALKKANDELAKANARLAAQKDAEAAAAAAPTASATPGEITAPTVIPGRPAADLSGVSGAVERIVEKAFAFDEIQMMCVRVLLDEPKSATVRAVKDNLFDTCARYVAQRAGATPEEVRTITVGLMASGEYGEDVQKEKAIAALFGTLGLDNAAAADKATWADRLDKLDKTLAALAPAPGPADRARIKDAPDVKTLIKDLMDLELTQLRNAAARVAAAH